MTPREPPSAARITEIRAIVSELSLMTSGKWAEGVLYVGPELLAALDYCRETLFSVKAALAAGNDMRARDHVNLCYDRLFREAP